MLLLLAGLATLGATSARALPDLSNPRPAGPLTLYPDHENRSLFYFEPGDLELARDRRGKPDLHFLQMRYVGTAVYGNEGETGSHSTLTLRIRMDGPTPAELAPARVGLARALGRRVELRPLPVADFEAVLVYAPVRRTTSESVEVGSVSGGHFEADGGREARSSRDAFWRERVYTLSLDPQTSQLFWKALQAGELVLSVGYAFFTRGVYTDEAPLDRGTALDLDTLREQIAGALDAADGDRDAQERLLSSLRGRLESMLEAAAVESDEALETHTRVARAGATAIRVDARRWPELFERVDFNQEAPPGYAALKVYCYDFRDGLRPDLFFKKVEILAEGVGGRDVPLETKFLSSQPDLYARTIRFPVAVHVDRPYRYRITRASRDGRVEVGDWRERTSWSRILDVTHRARQDGDDDSPSAEGEPG